MGTPGRIFFCDNCSTFRNSKKHWVRISDSSIITHDECERCGITQELEETDNIRRIATHRIKTKDEDKSENI